MNKNAVNKACPQLGIINFLIVLSNQKLIISVSEIFNDLLFYCISKCNMKRQLMSDFIYKARALPSVFKRIYFPAYILVKVFHYSKNNNVFLKRDQQWKSKFSECLKELQMKLQIGNESRNSKLQIKNGHLLVYWTDIHFL